MDARGKACAKGKGYDTVQQCLKKNERSNLYQGYQTMIYSKWIARVMKPADDTISHFLHEMYGSTLDWNLWATPQRDDSPFMIGLQGTFPLVQQFFRPQLGNGAAFRFWEDNWSDQGRLADGFPRLYALAADPSATVQSTRTGA